MPPHPSHEALDRTGMIASIGCAVHCMVAPLILLMAPALGGFWVHPTTHLLIAALVLPVAAFALRRGLRVHGRRWIAVAGIAGMALVAVGTMLPFVTHTAHAAGDVCQDCCPTLVVDEATGDYQLNVPPASIVTFLGGVLLVAAHFGNLRCCAACKTA